MSLVVGLFSALLLCIGLLLPFRGKKDEHPLFKLLRPAVRLLALFFCIYIVYYHINEKGFLQGHNNPDVNKLAGIWRVSGGSDGLGKVMHGTFAQGELIIFPNNSFSYKFGDACEIPGKWKVNEDYLILSFDKTTCNNSSEPSSYDLKSFEIKNSSFTDDKMVWFISEDYDIIKRNFIKVSELNFSKEFISTPFTKEETKNEKIRLTDLANKYGYFSYVNEKEISFALSNEEHFKINGSYFHIHNADSIFIDPGSTIEYYEEGNRIINCAIDTPNKRPIRFSIKGRILAYNF